MLKNKLKKIKYKITKTKKKKILTYNNKIIFSIKELCEIIDIKIPKEYKEESKLPFTETSVIEKLENKNEILGNIKKVVILILNTTLIQKSIY